MRQSEKTGISENADVFQRLAAAGQRNLRNFAGRCRKFPDESPQPPLLVAAPGSRVRPNGGVMNWVGLRHSDMNKRSRDDSSGVRVTTLSIAGMSCAACVHHVARALDGVRGVIHVEVDLRHNRATIEHLTRQATATVLVAAVQDAGYRARIAQSIGDSEAALSQSGSPASCGCGCCSDPRKSVDRSWDLGTSTIG